MSRLGEAFRTILIGVLLLAMAVSFVHGFGALISNAWPAHEAQRETLETWQILPPMQSVPSLSEGVDVSLAQYRFDVSGTTYRVPRLQWGEAPAARAEAYALSAWPQLAFIEPGFPWPTLLAIPLLCLLLALWLSVSGKTTRLLRETQPLRDRVAARRPVLK